MLTGVYETLRSAGRAADARARASAPTSPERLAELQRGGARASRPTPAATDKQLAAAQRRARPPARTPSGCSTSPRCARAGDRAASFEAARKRLEQARSTSSRARDSELLQELLDLFAAEYAAAKAARVGARLRGPAAATRATCCATTSGSARPSSCASARSWSTSSRTRTALQCELSTCCAAGRARTDVFFVGDEFQSIYGFRHADVDVFRERRAAAAQRLPLTRNYRSRPEVLAAVNHLFGEEFGDGYQPLAASGRVPGPGVRPSGRAARHRQARAIARRGEHWRDGEAQRDRAARARARRRGRRRAGRDRAALRGRHRRRAVRGGAARAGLPTYRATGPRLLRPAAGRRPARRTCGCCTTATTTRRSSPVLASPFVGVSNDALVLIRRHAGEAAALHRHRALAARAALARATSGSCARSSSATSGSSPPRRALLARAALRGDRLGARLRPRRARAAGTGSAATRTCAS